MNRTVDKHLTVIWIFECADNLPFTDVVISIVINHHRTYDTWQLIGAIGTDYLSWLQTEKRPSVKEKKKAQAETVPDSEKPFACARKFSK